MNHVTCRLTAKNRDQLRNATLGNRVWASFYESMAGEKAGMSPGNSVIIMTCVPVAMRLVVLLYYYVYFCFTLL